MTDLTDTIKELRALLAKATPGPYQGRFLHRVFESARNDSAILWGTKPEQDWDDCELMAEAVNNLLTLLDAAEKAERLEERVKVLEEKAKAVIDRWETPAWKNVEHTAVFINELKHALAGGKDGAYSIAKPNLLS